MAACSITSPCNKRAEQQKEEEQGFLYVYSDVESREIVFAWGVGGARCLFSFSDPLASLLDKLGPESVLFSDETLSIRINGRTALEVAIQENRLLRSSSGLLRVSKNSEFKPVESWLRHLKLTHHIKTFYRYYIDDFLVIPFLDASILSTMGIQGQDQHILVEAISKYKNKPSTQFFDDWTLFSGLPDSAFDIKTFYYTGPTGETRSHPKDALTRIHVTKTLERFSEFSSVEATYNWLREHGFGKVAFRFVRFNIPFYSLPLINFFIIHEMGIVNYKDLLQALQELKEMPSFRAKAVIYWLRDLQLEQFGIEFAKNNLGNMFYRLCDSYLDIRWGVPPSFYLSIQPEYHERLQNAIEDMKEFLQYFATTAFLVKVLKVEKYGKSISSCDITLDDIPTICDDKLIEIGIDCMEDRKEILADIKNMKKENSAIWSNFTSHKGFKTVDSSQVSHHVQRINT